MRFPMRNCLKYAQQYQNEIFKKTCQATMVPPFSLWISPRYYVHWKYESPLIPDAEKKTIFAALLLAEFKNRYVTANINLK